MFHMLEFTACPAYRQGRRTASVVSINEAIKSFFARHTRTRSVAWRACRAVAGLALLVGVLLKESSNINQKAPPSKITA